MTYLFRVSRNDGVRSTVPCNAQRPAARSRRSRRPRRRSAHRRE